MDYIKALNEVYNKHYVDNGKCKCLIQCKNNIECNHPSMSYRAKVGEKYGNGNHPKIMFIGQEAPRPSGAENRAVLFPATCPPCTMKDAGYNPHYLRTFYTLARLIKNSENQPNGYSRNDMIEYENLKDYLCLTNFYKCVFSDNNVRTGIEHSEEMKENCTEILLGEIEALSPQVVVFQGKNHTKFWESINYEAIIEKNIKIYEAERNHFLGLYKATYKDKDFYIIDSYHPTSHCWTNENVFNLFCMILDKTKKLLNNSCVNAQHED